MTDGVVDELALQQSASGINLNDQFLAHLNQAAALHQQLEQQFQQQGDQVRALRQQLDAALAANSQLSQSVQSLQQQAEAERQRAAHKQEQATQLAATLKSVHRSLFGGNIYELILRSCLLVTGATRGLYIHARAQDAPLRIRAAIDVDGYPNALPSEFLQAVCQKMLVEQDTFVCNTPEDLPDLPEPARPAEQFHNFLVAPVMLMRSFGGMVLVADKMVGEFNEEDAETLLSVGDEAAIALENMQLHQELQRAYLSIVSALADAVEAKDPYTHGHCNMVARQAYLTAKQLALPEPEQCLVYFAALLHDVGKIGVSDGILNKPGALLPEEREVIRSHVRIGYDLVCRVEALKEVARIVLHHHEWFDGNGYPGGIQGDDIPLAARIVGVVDAYNAMVTRRSYKASFGSDYAQDELKRYAGRQFDPQVVDAFLAILSLPEANELEADIELSCRMLPGLNRSRSAEGTLERS